MKVRFRERTPGTIDHGLLFGGIAAVVLLAAAVLPVETLLPSCAWHRLTGIPCPACGTTRSLLCLSRGEFPAAFALNPLASVALVSLVLALFAGVSARVLFSHRLTVECSAGERDAMRTAAISAVLLNWAYLVYRGV